MSEVKGQIVLEQHGVAQVLKLYRLAVPVNQREYSWTEKEVTTLLQDLTKAIPDDDG